MTGRTQWSHFIGARRSPAQICVRMPSQATIFRVEPLVLLRLQSLLLLRESGITTTRKQLPTQWGTWQPGLLSREGASCKSTILPWSLRKHLAYQHVSLVNHRRTLLVVPSLFRSVNDVHTTRVIALEKGGEHNLFFSGIWRG